MDKRIALAVAGSGKTKTIIDGIDPSKRILLITYTDNNLMNLRARVLDRFGYLPERLALCSYFTFLYSHCFRPFLWRATGARGIRWTMPHARTLRLRRTDDRYYFDRKNRAYHNRLAKLLQMRGVVEPLRHRLEKYFDYIFIDEFQDLAGHDFNLICDLVASEMDVRIYAAADFHQHTYDTSRDGNVNSSLYDDVERYKDRLKSVGFAVDTTSLSRSYRCSPAVCSYVTELLGITLESHRSDSTNVIQIQTEDDAKKILMDASVRKLFYQKHYDHYCNSKNWGASKGDEYENVCVVLNKTAWRSFAKGDARSLNPQTRNKLYVACTRSRGDLYIVSEELIRRCRTGPEAAAHMA